MNKPFQPLPPLTPEEIERGRRIGVGMGKASGVSKRNVPLMESYRERMEKQAVESLPQSPEAEPK